jgi:hypothetical protein
VFQGNCEQSSIVRATADQKLSDDLEGVLGQQGSSVPTRQMPIRSEMDSIDLQL